MAFGPAKSTISLEEILCETSEVKICAYYLNIDELPILIKSPLRVDKNPSFSIYIKDEKVYYYDFGNHDKGNLYDILIKMWGVTFEECLLTIKRDIISINQKFVVYFESTRCIDSRRYKKDVTLQVKIREWKDYDVKYWESYGISLAWLKYADVYPISHKIITKDSKTYVFGADKYAYVYVERKEGHVTLKIYQPFNKLGYKWSNSHDASVISLWTKIPEYGKQLCICASLKDALCLWSNTGIPSIALQGEGYLISDTAIKELKRRFENIYIIFDNDEAGIIDGIKLEKHTNFKNISLPPFDGGKDISDLYKSLQDKTKFKQTLLKLIKN